MEKVRHSLCILILLICRPSRTSGECKITSRRLQDIAESGRNWERYRFLVLSIHWLDFYYEKLREIEVLVDAFLDAHPNIAANIEGEAPTLKKIQNILFDGGDIVSWFCNRINEAILL